MRAFYLVNQNCSVTIDVKQNKIETIEFKDVSLSYDNVNIILDKISFKVDKPIQIAIVGKSGVGKTSLVNLISRFYDIILEKNKQKMVK